jgi:hypothetical protein
MEMTTLSLLFGRAVSRRARSAGVQKMIRHLFSPPWEKCRRRGHGRKIRASFSTARWATMRRSILGLREISNDQPQGQRGSTFV